MGCSQRYSSTLVCTCQETTADSTSSAAAERVFSLLASALTPQQDSALQDYLEASVMLRYNKAKRV